MLDVSFSDSLMGVAYIVSRIKLSVSDRTNVVSLLSVFNPKVRDKKFCTKLIYYNDSLKKWVDFSNSLLIHTAVRGSHFLYILQRSELLCGMPNSVTNTEFAKSGVG